MEKLTIEDITLKLGDLSYIARKEIYDFMNFLLQRQKKKKRPAREKLLHVSVWKENDLKAIEDAGKALSRWNIEKFL